MQYILSETNRPALVSFLQLAPLVAFDYDGTLAPLTPSRDAAFMRPLTRQLVGEAAARFDCVVITGRSLVDMRPRVDGLGLRAIVGNHGIEPSPTEAAFADTVSAWLPVIEPLGALPGVDIENKRLSVSLHYWRSPEPEQALAAITRASQSLGDSAVVVPGHFLVNLIPRGAPMKDGALRRLMAERGNPHAVFVGDDWNDERVFEHADPSRVLTVRVGNSDQSRARYYLRSQQEIDEFLKLVVDG